ncbi:DUF4265 domain-containing protein [Zunongwangia sp. F260]|uniref:DUF4265 domain-containing protein n=1 Tax=Autumnicola lenta TaxID=3075593 RepID=A0ABU3CQ53_9FLAO|nr:DUF4265 domain-containing protein [Zunongwangia sp. F260]MDT0648406.1 DUF4265 domain-containing protein [Zunongwangia sp. F260]MDT0648410.1 DUF4265 domain-containing protein [Zunongwangia sp. F260]
MKQEKEKVLFRFYSNIFDEEMVETMWCQEIDKENGIYKLDNIPFYAPLLASDDIIFAEFDESEQMITYRETKEFSGNSVIQIVLMDEKSDLNEIRNSFMKSGCQSEKFSENYFSMEIPYDLNYNPIKAQLDTLENDDIVSYVEPCLSEKHKNDSQE